MSFKTGIFLFAAVVLTLAGCSSSEERAQKLGAQAQILYDARDYNGAETAIRESIALRDDDIQLYLLYGQIEAARGDAEAAYTAFYNGLSLDASNPQALLAVAQLGLQTGHIREATDAADAILVISPEQPEALLVKGILAVGRNKYDEALGLADRIIAASPSSEIGPILKARALAKSGKVAEGLDVMEKAAVTTGYTPSMIRATLELYRVSGNLAGLLDMFARLHISTPKDANLAVDYANTLYKSGRLPEARSLLVDALREKPSDKQIADNITALWAEYDDHPLSDGDMAFLSSEGSVESRIAISRYLLSKKQPEAAASILKNVANQHWEEAKSVYARALLQSGQAKQAGAIAQEILDHDKTNADAMLIQVDELLAKQDMANALNTAQIVVSQNPRFVDGYLALAKVFSAQGDEVAARRIYEDGIKLLPQNPILFKSYRDYLLQHGKGDRAVSAMQQFSRKTPSLISAWQLYGQTCAAVRGASCATDAKKGEQAARLIYAIDLPPGSPPSRNLLDRL